MAVTVARSGAAPVAESAAPAEISETRRRPISRWFRRHLPLVLSIAVAGVLVAVWYWVTTSGRVSRFVLPTPGSTVRALYRGLISDGQYRDGLWVTGQQIALGFLIGAGAGIVLALLLAASRVAEQVVYPYVVFLQTLPKVAIAPLFIIWFGFGITSKVVLVALLVAFPVLVNTLEGLKATPQSRIDLLRAFGANRWQLFWQVRIPTAMPYIFAGLDIGIVFAPVGAVVAEFVGATRGLGVSVLQAQLNLDTAGVFALLLILGFLGIALHGVLQVVRRRVIFWERFTRSPSPTISAMSRQRSNSNEPETPRDRGET
jgi:NitT/TauT family transport system permease protein